MAQFKVDNFDGMNDFGLWHIKMKVLLVQHALEGAIKGEVMLVPTLSDVKKKKQNIEINCIS